MQFKCQDTFQLTSRHTMFVIYDDKLHYLYTYNTLCKKSHRGEYISDKLGDRIKKKR